MFRETVLEYYREHPEEAQPYREELLRLESCYDDYMAVYPYPFYDQYMRDYTAVAVGRENGLPWVEHQGRRLFFPAHWNDGLVRYKYRYLCMEQDPGSSHCYLTPELREKRFDVLIDAGCAEGMLALELIDTVERVLLIECDADWLPALEATFVPWKDKVMILRQTLGDTDRDEGVTLRTLARRFDIHNALLKLDIEGFEGQAIAGAGDLPGYASAVLCCTYHRAQDADARSDALGRYGYRLSFSKGYMLFASPPAYLPLPEPPYFRRGLVRAVL